MLLVTGRYPVFVGVMVAVIARLPREVGRYWQVAVCDVPEPTVLTPVQPGIAKLLTKNVTFPGVFTFAAMGFVCR